MTLRELRIRAGLTQEQVAKPVDVNQAAVSNWELGKNGILRKYRKPLAKLYGVSDSELAAAMEETKP